MHSKLCRLLLILCLLSGPGFGLSCQGADGNLPTLFIIGDSTVNNHGNGLQGWGTPIAYFFDTNRIRVENDAIGGRSSRSFLREGRWDRVLEKLKAGDFVLMQLGHNDGGSFTDGRDRNTLHGTGNESVVVTNSTGQLETVHTYGWYMRKYVVDTKQRGATPIMVTLIPRNDWVDGRIPRSNGSYAGWAKEIAREENIQVVDLNDIAARHYEELGTDHLRADVFIHEHTHTSVEGARLNAACVVEGLRSLPGCALAAYLLPPSDVSMPPLPEVNYEPPFWRWASAPVMGWNSWDSFATTINEAQVNEEAGVLATLLKPHGWQYLVVDIQWYEPQATGYDYRPNARLSMDAYGRLLPAPNRFPSSVNGQGFKPLADKLHSMGLKFGLHLMRGIPRQAVAENCPILNSSAHAADIADKQDVCAWNHDEYGVDMRKPGAQAYYDSVVALLASWDVDFIKVDDLSRPFHAAELEAIRKAIDRSGRQIVLSTSPGPTPIADGYAVSGLANQWRISDDFWDKWSSPHESMHGLKEQFAPLAAWAAFSGPGHFADADMLPLGVLDLGKRSTHLTHVEQQTLISLWCIARSPLIMGGDLVKLDDFTRSLLTNDEVLTVDQTARDAHQIFNHEGLISWVSKMPAGLGRYVGLFNTTDEPATVTVTLDEAGVKGPVQVRNLWTHQNMGTIADSLKASLPPHGSGLYRLSAD